MQEISAHHALVLSRSWFAEADNLFDLLWIMRRRSPGFVPTFLSAYAVRRELPAELADEVEQVRERLRRLRLLQDVITAGVPGAVALKGLAVADAYPAGLVRRSADLDLLAPDRTAVWRIARIAAADYGMHVRSVTTFPVRAGLKLGEGLMVAMAALPKSAFDEPLTLDVSTHAVVGNGTTIPAWAGAVGRGAGTAHHLVMVAAERLEEPFSVKEVFDATVLAGQLAAAGDPSLSAAWQLAAEANLQPELAALLDLAARHGMPIPVLDQRPVRRARLERALGLAATVAAHPVQAPLHAMQVAEVLPKPMRGVRRAVWRAADRRLPVTARVRAALFRFGLPVEVTGETDRPILRSPYGDFLLVNSADVAENWLEDVRPSLTCEDPDLVELT